ncbi:MAG: hypothetical protein ACR2PH_12200 [Desulfobulbia bacterium]
MSYIKNMVERRASRRDRRFLGNRRSNYMRYIHAANEENKRLGLFWQRLIAQDFVTEEDALLLAENFFQGSGGYSDEMAQNMVRNILSDVADQYRTKTTVTPVAG